MVESEKYYSLISPSKFAKIKSFIQWKNMHVTVFLVNVCKLNTFQSIDTFFMCLLFVK